MAILKLECGLKTLRFIKNLNLYSFLASTSSLCDNIKFSQNHTKK